MHEIPKRVRPQLLAETEFLDHSLIAIGIVGFEIIEQATPLADQHEKTAARAVVLLVHLEVFRQSTNPFAQQSDLNFRTTGIGSMRSVLVDEGFLLLSG
jgi:arginine exporter protein ArgO